MRSTCPCPAQACNPTLGLSLIRGNGRDIRISSKVVIVSETSPAVDTSDGKEVHAYTHTCMHTYTHTGYHLIRGQPNDSQSKNKDSSDASQSVEEKKVAEDAPAPTVASANTDTEKNPRFDRLCPCEYGARVHVDAGNVLPFLTAPHVTQSPGV